MKAVLFTALMWLAVRCNRAWFVLFTSQAPLIAHAPVTTALAWRGLCATLPVRFIVKAKDMTGGLERLSVRPDLAFPGTGMGGPVDLSEFLH